MPSAFRRARPVLLGLLALAAAASILWGAYEALGPEGSRDSQWSGAHVLLLGQDPSQIFVDCRTKGCDPNPFLLSQYPNYPISGLMTLWPLAALPWDMAKTVWVFVNLFATAAIFWCLPRLAVPKPGGVALAIAFMIFLISTPYRNHIVNGQQGLYTLALFALAAVSASRGWKILAGLLLTLAWFKFTLTLPLSILFVARRDWIVLAVAVAAHLALTAFAALWTHTDPIALTFGFLRVARYAVNPGLGYIDLFGLAAHLGLSAWIAGIAAALLLAASVYLAMRIAAEDEFLLLSVLSFLAMTIFYHFTYDCVIFVFPFVLAAALIERGKLFAAEGLFAIPALVAILMTWFVHRAVLGSAAVNALDQPRYRIFYWLLIVATYAALGGGLYRLWKTRVNFTWRPNLAASPGPRATR